MSGRRHLIYWDLEGLSRDGNLLLKRKLEASGTNQPNKNKTCHRVLVWLQWLCLIFRMRHKLFFTLERQTCQHPHYSFCGEKKETCSVLFKAQSFIPISKPCLCLNKLEPKHQSALGSHKTENTALAMRLAAGCHWCCTNSLKSKLYDGQLLLTGRVRQQLRQKKGV